MLDLSADGLLLGEVHDLTPGEPLDVVVDLPEGTLHLDAVVKFVGTTRYGTGSGVEITPAPGWIAHYRALADHAIHVVPRSIQRYLRRRTGTG